MYRTDFWTMWEKARVGCFEKTALKHVYYLGWNRSPAQVGYMRQVLRPGALGRPRGIGWRGRGEGGLGWGTHVNPRLIHVNVWQNPLQYCKVISLQLIKINGKKNQYYNFPISSLMTFFCFQWILMYFSSSKNIPQVKSLIRKWISLQQSIKNFMEEFIKKSIIKWQSLIKICK